MLWNVQPNLPRKLVESRSWQRVEIVERQYHKQPKILGIWEVDPRLLKKDRELQFAMAIKCYQFAVIESDRPQGINEIHATLDIQTNSVRMTTLNGPCTAPNVPRRQHSNRPYLSFYPNSNITLQSTFVFTRPRAGSSSL